MAAIPANIGEVTSGWLSEVMGLPVTGCRSEQFGVGIGVSSALYRVHLEGDGVPPTVVVKMPALDPAAVFTSTVLRMYLREAHFFRDLAASSPIRVPGCFHTAVDEETSAFVLVLEDMGSLRCADQITGMAIGDAEHAVDELAGWHARFWGKADAMAEEGLTVRLGDPIYPAILPMVFAEGWDKVTAEIEGIPREILDVGPRFSDAIPHLLNDLDQAPTTLAHGDYRADNILFDVDGTCVLLDFQLIGTGSGAYDLAYFVTQSLDADIAGKHEQALFDRWRDGLVKGGVPEADLERMWEDYRKAALFCLVYPIVASRGMDLTDRRQHDLVCVMNSRFSRAVDQLSLTDLL
jgi:hypothetical protein